IGAGYRLAARQVLGLEVDPIGCEDEFRLRLGRGRTCLQRRESLGDLALATAGNVDVVGLKNAAQVGLIRCASAKPFDRRVLIPEGLKESEGEFDRVEWLLGESRDSFFDLNGVHMILPRISSDVLARAKETQRLKGRQFVHSISTAFICTALGLIGVY